MLALHVALGVAVLASVSRPPCWASSRTGARGRGRVRVPHARPRADGAHRAGGGRRSCSSDGRRAPEKLHYAYGAFALGLALTPWFYAPGVGPKRLLWFAVTTLVAGALAVRAFMTGS